MELEFSVIDDNFGKACDLIIGNKREAVKIGTLSEKTLHAVLKYTIESDEINHEIKVGSYYADIFNQHGITEIQTRNFNALRKKLSYFLEEHVVTVVYPIPHKKWLSWIDNETGEITKKRKSPKTGAIYDVFFELYKIKPFLTHKNIRLCLILLEVTEYRNLNGWSKDKKKGSSRHDRIPEKITDIVKFDGSKDYINFIPEGLGSEFTTKDYAKACKMTLRNAQVGINILKSLNVIVQTSKKGNLIIYSLSENL